MPRRPLVTSLVALAALLPAACGGGDEESTSSASDPETTTTTAGEQQSAESDVFFGFLKVAPPTRNVAGAQVRQLEAGAPFAVAGMLPRDLVVSVDGVLIANPDGLVQLLEGLGETHDPGDEVEVLVARGSKEKTKTLAVVLAPNVLIGAEVKDSPKKAGVAVVKVPPDGPAADAGLEPEDVITEVDGAAVENVDGLFRVLGSHAAGDELSLTVSRGSGERTVRLTVVPRPGS